MFDIFRFQEDNLLNPVGQGIGGILATGSAFHITPKLANIS
jgi:hypothetical protein